MEKIKKNKKCQRVYLGGKISEAKSIFAKSKLLVLALLHGAYSAVRKNLPDEHSRVTLAKIENFRLLDKKSSKNFRKQSGERSGEGGSGRFACQTYTR